MKVSQTDKLYDLLSDGNAHRTDEIVNKIYNGGSLARVGARIFDVKKKYGVEIIGWHDEDNPSLYWYQIEVTPHYGRWFDKDKMEKLVSLQEKYNSITPDVPLEEMPEFSEWNKQLSLM